MICEICGAEGAEEQIDITRITYKYKEAWLELRFTECLECDTDYCTDIQVAANAKEMEDFRGEVDD